MYMPLADRYAGAQFLGSEQFRQLQARDEPSETVVQFVTQNMVIVHLEPPIQNETVASRGTA